MIINGKERKFKLTVGASMEIAELCPGSDLQNIKKVLTGKYSEVMKAVVKIIVAMNKGYEEARRFEEPGYVPDALTEAEVAALDPQIFKDIRDEALTAFKKDSEQNVEVQPSKKKATQ